MKSCEKLVNVIYSLTQCLANLKPITIWVWCVNGRMLSTQSLVKTWLYLVCTADSCQDSPKCSDQIPLIDTNSTLFYILDRCALSWRKHAPTIHLMFTNVTLYNSFELTGKIHIILYTTHSFVWICTIQAIFCKFFFKLFSKHYKENKSQWNVCHKTLFTHLTSLMNQRKFIKIIYQIDSVHLKK